MDSPSLKHQKSSESAQKIHSLIQQLDAATEVFFQQLLTLADRLEEKQGGRKYHIVMLSQLARSHNLCAETYAHAVQCRTIESHLRKRYMRNRINIVEELRRLLRHGYCDRADGHKGTIAIHPIVAESISEILDAQDIQAISAIGVQQ